VGLSRLIWLCVDLANPAFITGFVAEPHPAIAVARVLRWCILAQVLKRSVGRKGHNNGVGRRGTRSEIDRLAGTDLVRRREILRGRGIRRRRWWRLGWLDLHRDFWFFAGRLLAGRFGRFGGLLNLCGGSDNGDEIREWPRKPSEESSRTKNTDSYRENHRDADHEAGAT
jgi:hypothetical protein